MFISIMAKISLYAIPLIITFIVCYAYFVKKIKVYEVFCDGAKEGFTTAIKIIPYLVAILVAIGIFRASGAIDIMLKYLNPVLNFIGIPGEILPLAIIRPLSGSGANGVLNDIFLNYGADSMIGRISSTMAGSTETIFYTVAVYYGAIGIKKIRHTVLVGLIAQLASLLASVWICKLVF